MCIVSRETWLAYIRHKLTTDLHDRDNVSFFHISHSGSGRGCIVPKTQVGGRCASYHDNRGTILGTPEQRAHTERETYVSRYSVGSYYLATHSKPLC